MFNLKKIFAPKTNEIKEIDAVQMWIVSWTSRHSEFASGTKMEFEAFTDIDVANEYADALRAAFKLIKHTSNIDVSVTKN